MSIDHPFCGDHQTDAWTTPMDAPVRIEKTRREAEAQIYEQWRNSEAGKRTIDALMEEVRARLSPEERQ